MIPANKKDKNLDSIMLTSNLPPSNYLSYNYNIESCSLVGLYFIHKKNMKRDKAKPKYYVSLLHERVDYQVIVYSCTKPTLLTML